jgi:hypothetical protein
MGFSRTLENGAADQFKIAVIGDAPGMFGNGKRQFASDR